LVPDGADTAEGIIAITMVVIIPRGEEATVRALVITTADFLAGSVAMSDCLNPLGTTE